MIKFKVFLQHSENDKSFHTATEVEMCLPAVPLKGSYISMPVIKRNLEEKIKGDSDMLAYYCHYIYGKGSYLKTLAYAELSAEVQNVDILNFANDFSLDDVTTVKDVWFTEDSEYVTLLIGD